MRVHTKVKRALLVLLALALLVGTSTTISPLQGMREKYDLTNEPVKGISPQLALGTQVMGWARGIVISVLWIRMEALERQGRFFELVQLADWACKLTPSIPRVWDIQAWNMAYNVSSRVRWLEDRWAWVRSGIELLRDEAIPTNPNAVELYFSLAYTIHHKIGQEDDYAHPFYKRELAREMHELLGGGGDKETLGKFVEAPGTRRELLQDDDVRRFVADCAQYGFDIVEDFFLLYRDRGAVREEVLKIVDQSFNRDAFEKVAAFVRARRLRDDYSMDPQYMIKLMERYGPFDWRSPFPHAIYWASRGLDVLAEREGRFSTTADAFGLPQPYTRAELDEMHGDRETAFEFQRVRLERTIYAALQSLVAHGRMLVDSEGDVLYTWGSDYRFAGATLEFFQRALDTWGARYQSSVSTAYRHFLVRGIVEFHFMGESRRSRQYFDLLQEEFPLVLADISYDEFLQRQLREHMHGLTYSQARRQTHTLLVRSLLYMGYGELDAAGALEEQARFFAENFEDDEGLSLRERIPFGELKQTALIDLLAGGMGQIPDEVHENLRAQLESEVGEERVAQMLREVEEMRSRPMRMQELDERFMVDPTTLPSWAQ